jgi:hypothetical protein
MSLIYKPQEDRYGPWQAYGSLNRTGWQVRKQWWEFARVSVRAHCTKQEVTLFVCVMCECVWEGEGLGCALRCRLSILSPHCTFHLAFSPLGGQKTSQMYAPKSPYCQPPTLLCTSQKRLETGQEFAVYLVLGCTEIVSAGMRYTISTAVISSERTMY